MPWRPTLLRAVVLVSSIVVASTCSNSADVTPRTGFSADQRFVGDAASVVATARAWAEHESRLVRFPDPSDPALDRYLAGDRLALARIDLRVRALGLMMGVRPPATALVRRIDAVSVVGDRAVIQECDLERARREHPISGVTSGALVPVLAAETVARRTVSGWRLVSRTVHPSPGTASCPVSP